jgi:hypothetical protein
LDDQLLEGLEIEGGGIVWFLVESQVDAAGEIVDFADGDQFVHGVVAK